MRRCAFNEFRWDIDPAAHIWDLTHKVNKKVPMKQIDWCCIPVIIDDDTTELFHMPSPDEDAEQQPVFHVTKSTANLVSQDFPRYQPSLQRMADDWRADKKRVMQEREPQKASI